MELGIVDLTLFPDTFLWGGVTGASARSAGPAAEERQPGTTGSLRREGATVEICQECGCLPDVAGGSANKAKAAMLTALQMANPER